VPPVSQSQRGLVYATLAGAHTGMPLDVAREFAASDKPGRLPERVPRDRADGGRSFDDNVIDVATRLARQPMHRQLGGFAAAEDMPWTERAAARELEQPYGFSLGTGAGRNDKNNVNLASGSYVLPADVVAGLGEGNSLAGAKMWGSILTSMPHGISSRPARPGGHGLPRPPAGREIPGEGGVKEPPIQPGIAHGGRAEDGEDTVPVVSADGELILKPEEVQAIGAHYFPAGRRRTPEAELRFGHEVLDEFTKEVRGRTIAHLKKLPGPRGSKNPKVGHA